MKASDLLVECLEIEGVECVFGIPGEELEDILFSVRDSSIRFIPVRHEQGAAFMADVYGRLTGDAGVCLSTLGPGATNLLTGVADAQLDKAPVVAVTGQVERERIHRESHQTLAVLDIFEPVVKWNTQITDADVVPESVRKAFQLAEFEKPGATHIEFPEDVAREETDATPLPPRKRVRRPNPDPESLKRAGTLLTNADRPLVLAGNGAVRTRAVDPLEELVTHLDMPVVATFMGKGAISDRHEGSLMTLESGPNTESMAAIEQADCILAVGYDIAEHDPRTWNPDGENSIIHLDHEAAEVYRQYNPTVEIVADIPASLQALQSETPAGSREKWWRELRDRIITAARREPESGEALSVEGTLPYLREAMADGDVLISDVGNHKQVIAKQFLTFEPNTCIISNGLASMGIAVPGGVAADLVTDGNVVVVTGDGGFLMNAAEIETATRLGCGGTIVVFNDNDYGMISSQQVEHRGEAFGTGLTNPDLVAFAESFGIPGYRLDDWAAVSSGIAEIIHSDELSLIEIPLPG